MTDVLVIGAGPYGLSAAKAARDKGLSTRIVGRHMAFWREHMPADMFLRSGPDWHLDPAGELTLERYLADVHGQTPDPLPIGVFLAYTEWFTATAGLEIEDEHVTALRAGVRGHARVRRDDPRARRRRGARHRPLHPRAPSGRRTTPSTPATSSTSTTSPARTS